MSIFIDVSMHNREQIAVESVVRFEPYLARRTKTIFSRCFGLAEAFIEIDGPIVDYAVERTSDGFTLWVGRVNVNLSWTTGHVKMAKVICMGLVVGAAFTLSGFPRWGVAKPLEIVLWAAMVKRYIV